MSLAVPTAVVLATLAAGPAGGRQDSRVREEVERQLKELTKIPDAQASLSLAPAAGYGYALEEASLELDGRALPLPPLEMLKESKGSHEVFAGPIADGTHQLSIGLVYAGDFGLLSYATGYKFKLRHRVSFEAHRGLKVVLQVAPKVDDTKEWQQRLAIAVQRSDLLLAQIDTTEPEPLVRPTPAPSPPSAPPTPPQTASEPVKKRATAAAPQTPGKGRPRLQPGREAAPAPPSEPPAAPDSPVEQASVPTAPPKAAMEPDSAGQPTAPPGTTSSPPAPLEPSPPASSGGDVRLLVAAGLFLLVAAISFFTWQRRGSRRRG